MKKITISLLVQLILLTAVSGQERTAGKWDGGIAIDAGTNFKEGWSIRKYSFSSGGVSGWGRYSTDKFTIRLDAACLAKYSVASISAATVSVKDPDAPQANTDIKHNESPLFDEQAGVLMEFTPDSRNRFSLKMKQKFGRRTPENFIISMLSLFSRDVKEPVFTEFSFNMNEGLQKIGEYGAEAKWAHDFDKPGRVIESRAEWILNRNDNSSTWQRSKADSIGSNFSTHTFRITPVETKNDVNLAVKYRDKSLFNLETFDLELNADLSIRSDLDRLSAANFVNDIWTDSLNYQRNFDYLSINFSPKMKLSYSPGRFNINLQINPDLHADRLGEGRDRRSLNFNKIYILPDLDIYWTPSPMHKLGISYIQGLTRPSYLQVCPFRRHGAYAYESETGNPGLKPCSNGKASVLYSFHSGFFTGTLEAAGKLTWSRIDRVFNTEGIYRIYTWINSGNSIENNVKLTLKAETKNFNAEIGGYYNYFIGYNETRNDTKSSDWGINGNATLKIRGGWTFNAKGRYQSKIIRTYSSITEYVACDFKVMKDFKRFSLYLEGKDLFDQDIEISTLSEDRKNVRFEEYFYNRRLFSVGASFRF